MTSLTVSSKAKPPAPLSPDLDRHLAFVLAKVDPRGMGFSIPAEFALTADELDMVQRRYGGVVAFLAPAGEDAALMALASMQLMMLDAGASSQEADTALDLWVKNLADLPVFAIEAATQDFLRGDAGERGFVPKLPIFRQHALGKLTKMFEHKSQLGKLIEAHKHIAPPRSTSAKRAENVAKARDVIRDIALAGQKAEERRAGRVIEDEPPKKLDTEAELFARLKSEASRPVAPLSASGRRASGLPDIFEENDAQVAAR